MGRKIVAALIGCEAGERFSERFWLPWRAMAAKDIAEDLVISIDYQITAAEAEVPEFEISSRLPADRIIEAFDFKCL
ncbi:hypothetical protein Nepgr_010588 [Nepenthes gracilis]|uniref:Uncharacterized protein n=1 Tax=Nepenthes gracilis TaxID=150966 RepID=A0AAD3SCN1_NEPGR|nr:hypothetical protein Nepgr_010588 [Nepenthes gracilis]